MRLFVNVKKTIADSVILPKRVGTILTIGIGERKQRDIIGVHNKFAASISIRLMSYLRKGGDSRVRNHAVFANLELGWKSMLYLTLTDVMDWNSRLVNTDEDLSSIPQRSAGLISEMVKLPNLSLT
jgi:hypothetical protein